MSMGGSSPAGNATTTQMPAPYMLPYISTALGQANNLLTYAPQFYPGQTVADFTGPQQDAMGAIAGLGMNGSQAGNAADNFDASLLNGDYSGAQRQLAAAAHGSGLGVGALQDFANGGQNPYLDAMFKQAAGATQSQLASEFGGAGRNVDASQPLRGEQLNNLATNLYGNAYQQDMNRALQAQEAATNARMGAATTLSGEQMEALGEAPALNAMDFNNLNQALNIGNMTQQQAQKLIDSNMQRYNYYQQLPIQQLQTFESLLSGVQPGMQQTSPYFNNPTANLMNLGMMGYNMYNNYQNMYPYTGSMLPQQLNTLDNPSGSFDMLPIDSLPQ